MNLSKSGIGYSWGFKGYRITKTANNTVRRTASIPNTGISYVEEQKIPTPQQKQSIPVQKCTQPESDSIAEQVHEQKKERPYWIILLLVIAAILILMIFAIWRNKQGVTGRLESGSEAIVSNAKPLEQSVELLQEESSLDDAPEAAVVLESGGEAEAELNVSSVADQASSEIVEIDQKSLSNQTSENSSPAFFSSNNPDLIDVIPVGDSALPAIEDIKSDVGSIKETRVLDSQEASKYEEALDLFDSGDYSAGMTLIEEVLNGGSE